MVLSGILKNIPRVTCIFWYTHEPLGECVCLENTSDKWDILQYATRIHCITILYHATENKRQNFKEMF